MKVVGYILQQYFTCSDTGSVENVFDRISIPAHRVHAVFGPDAGTRSVLTAKVFGVFQ